MGTEDRRTAILEALVRRRHDKMANLALEFGVSIRTVRRDIETLSLYAPIRTVQGRYGGGVYILDTYSYHKKFLDQEQIEAIEKAIGQKTLTEKDKHALKLLLTDFAKPTK